MPANPTLPRFRSLIATVAVAAAVSTAPFATASTSRPSSLPELVSRAELIVDGEVVSIEHRNADLREPGERPRPHTFVTLRIHRLIKGRPERADAMTLRFLGGPNGAGQRLVVSDIPTFAVGDRDILFIEGNGERSCPLVGGTSGRLRVVRGQVYDHAGVSLWITPEARLAALGEQLDLDTLGYPRLAGEASAEPGHEPLPPEGSSPADRAGFVAILDEIYRQQAMAGAPMPPIARDANIGETFYARRYERAAPPEDPAPGKFRPHPARDRR